MSITKFQTEVQATPYDDAFGLAVTWATEAAEADEFEALLYPGAIGLRIDPDRTPTLAGLLTDGEPGQLDLTTPFGQGFHAGAIAVHEAATDTGDPSNDESVTLTTGETQAILARIERTRRLADEAAYERGCDLGPDWADAADPDEIEALQDLDLTPNWDRDLDDLGLPSLAEWLTNDREGGCVRYLNLTNPFHRGVIDSALKAIPGDHPAA